jgi:hypothetical protein
MTDPPKKSIGATARNTMHNLVKSIAASNDKNYRLQYSPSSNNTKEHKMNSSQQKKQTSNENENDKSSPKPLLDCLQPGPLLTSKPYEKSMSQRRRRNKPFDPENLGRKFFLFYLFNKKKN